MKNIQTIKKQINSIQNIGKLTNAMKIVATSKINSAKNEFMNSIEFSNGIYSSIADLLFSASSLDLKEMIPSTNKTNTLWILVTSSTGMCGGFNISNLKDFSNKIKPTDGILCFGSKGQKYLARNGFAKNIVKYQHINDRDFNFFQLSYINKLVLKLYNKGIYANVKIQYMSFINSILTKPKTVDLFPLVLKNFETFKTSADVNCDDNLVAVLSSLFESYISASIYTAICESRICEQISRKNAMTEATKNKDEKIFELKLLYNKRRQEKITNEVAILSSSQGASW